MKPLTYSDYINDLAIIESLRLPQTPPLGQSPDTWPLWRRPGESGAGVEWSPGDPWPRGAPWAHEEVLFIRTHQAFETWFALILHELDDVLHRAVHLAGASAAPSPAFLPRVELESRYAEDAPHIPAHFPAMERAASAARSPAVAARVRAIPAPGRHFVDTPLRLRDVPPSELRAWTGRLDRASAALRVTVPFFDVLATMTPAQFLAFRGRLVPASGFGSIQFRELELTCGLRESNRNKIQPPGGTAEQAPGQPPLPQGLLRPTEQTPAALAGNAVVNTTPPGAWARIARRYNGPNLRDLVYGLLSAAAREPDVYGITADPGSRAGASDPPASAALADDNMIRAAADAFAARNVSETLHDWRQSGMEHAAGAESLLTERMDDLGEMLSHRETIIAALLHMHEPSGPTLGALTGLLHAALRLDGALLNWRDSHVRFVEMMIGARPGTGGGGIKYLRNTIDASRKPYLTHAFPCLWQARSLVQKT